MSNLKEKSPKRPDATDAHVGARIRMQRRLIGLSQTTLGEGIGVTFQQLQKYEKGANRVGPSRLQAIANILRVPVSFFFDQGPATVVGADHEDTAATDRIMRFLHTDDGISLSVAFAKIRDETIRKKVIGLVKSLADED